jgi:hypothetical protein
VTVANADAPANITLVAVADVPGTVDAFLLMLSPIMLLLTFLRLLASLLLLVVFLLLASMILTFPMML